MNGSAPMPGTLHARIIAAWLLAITAGACSSDATGPRAIRLRFASQPAPIVAGATQTVAVEFLDADGGRMTGIRDEVTLTLSGSGTGGASWTERAVQGVATFADVTIGAAGAARTLRATAGALAAVSLPFDVAAAGPSAELSSLVPGAAELVSNTPTLLTFTFRDALGNAIPNVTVSVSAAGATFAPSTGTTTVDGRFESTVRASPGALTVSASIAGATISLLPVLIVADACAPLALAVPGVATGALFQGAGCIAQGRPVAIHAFTTAALGGVTFDVRPSFSATFEVRAEPERPTIEFIVSDSAAVEWYLPAGAYQFRISAAAGSGNWTATSTTGAGATGQNAKVLAAAGTYTGHALTTDDLYDGLWYSDMFLFADPRPCTITLRSTAFDAYLFILNALTGSTVNVADDGGGGTDAQVTRASCLSIGQPIIIVPTSAFPDEVGPYTLTVTVHDAPPAGASSEPLRITLPTDLLRILKTAAAARTRQH